MTSGLVLVDRKQCSSRQYMHICFFFYNLEPYLCNVSMIAIQIFVLNLRVHSTICMFESVVAESFLVNEAAVLSETYSMND